MDIQPRSTLHSEQSESEPAVKRSSKAGRKAPARSKATPILHFLSTQPFASPFDVNMAVDAGYKVVITHTNAKLEHTTPLVQDAIFSRPPEHGCRTGLFIGGKDALLALDMLSAARAALVPPFVLSAFADPGGSFTTAAAMVAIVEDIYRRETGQSLKGANVAIFGATGVVGLASAIIAAQCGAAVTVVSHIGPDALKPIVRAGKERFGIELRPVCGARDSDKKKIVSGADVVLCAAAAGIRVLKEAHFTGSKRLTVVGDVNAVPPSGIEGVELYDRGRVLSRDNILSIGPLAIGDIKYQTQAALFRRMATSQQTMMFDFTDAFSVARDIVRKQKNVTQGRL